MPRESELTGKIVKEYSEKYTDTPNLTLAKKIYAENPGMFDSVEHIRTVIRYYRNAAGNKNRKRTKSLGVTTPQPVEIDMQVVYDKKIKFFQNEITELKKYNSALLEQSIIYDNLIEIFEANLKNTYHFPVATNKLKKSSDMEIIFNLSDLHLGEVVVSSDIYDSNEYNKDICIERLNIIFDKLCHYAGVVKVSKLHLILNGDLISGGIHQELARNSDLNEVEAVLFLYEYLVSKITEISKYFEKINIEVIVGNHARIMSGKPYYKEMVSMNYEYLLGKMLDLYFETLKKEGKNNRIKINVPESAFTVKQVQGLKFLITHGNIMTGAGTGGFAGIPFYALAMSAAKLYGVLHDIGVEKNVYFDHIIMGHLHSTNMDGMFNGGFNFINGCVIGTNEFSLYKMKSKAKKEQNLLVIDGKRIDGFIVIDF